MCMVKKKHLLAINGLMWTAIGIKISITGISHYLKTPPEQLWWMIPLSVLVFAGFYRMFTGIVQKYSERIQSLSGPKEPVYKTFSLKGYLIIAFIEKIRNHEDLVFSCKDKQAQVKLSLVSLKII